MKQIIIAGAGASGMMAAIAAARFIKENDGDKKALVTVIEHNDKIGKKLFITGKGRCNVTNACDVSDLFLNISRNPKFLYSAIYSFDNQAVMDFFEAEGLRLKIERGNRVFPESDHSSDVIRVLENAARKAGVKILLGTKISDVKALEKGGFKVDIAGRDSMAADAIILATGGVSYETTGSTGDGIKWSQKLGHKTEELRPALVPFVCSDEYVKNLQGLSLKNVTVSIYDEHNKKLFEEFGEMLFTHFGVSGPLILSASSVVCERLKASKLKLLIDLKPALDFDTLDKRILRDFSENINRNFENAVQGLLPSRLIPVVIELSGIDPHMKVHDVTRTQREQFLKLLKALPLCVAGTRNFNEAIITRGGVSVKDIDPSTMMSKRIENLYFAGEMIDVDAKTGGFNLQIAFSTGYLAGLSAAEKILFEK